VAADAGGRRRNPANVRTGPRAWAAIVLERFDETGGMQLIVHAPVGRQDQPGARPRLRKKFCLTFDSGRRVPSLAACQDNAPAGPIEIPDHPLVRETLGDCLSEAMDIDGFQTLVRRFEQGTVRLHFVDTVEPSVLAHEILGGAPFSYIDEDTEIGERRSRPYRCGGALPVEPRELGRLDPDAIARVRAEATPEVRDPDELHDVLLSLVAARPRPEWAEHFAALASAGRCLEDVVDDLARAALDEQRPD
jgi:hypothetical protein